MPQGFALTQAASLEIIAAYGSPQVMIPAVDATPGWQVLGAFFLPKSTRARLDALMMVSDPSLTCRVRLYDASPGAIAAAARVIPGLATSQSLTMQRRLGPLVSLVGSKLYQIQAEVIGDSGDTYFGVVPTATITN